MFCHCGAGCLNRAFFFFLFFLSFFFHRRHLLILQGSNTMLPVPKHSARSTVLNCGSRLLKRGGLGRRCGRWSYAVHQFGSRDWLIQGPCASLPPSPMCVCLCLLIRRVGLDGAMVRPRGQASDVLQPKGRKASPGHPGAKRGEPTEENSNQGTRFSRGLRQTGLA